MRKRDDLRWTEQVRMFQRLAPMAIAKHCIDYCLMGSYCVNCDEKPEPSACFCEKALFRQPTRRDMR